MFNSLRLKQTEIDFVDFISTLHEDTKKLFRSSTGTVFTIKIGNDVKHEREDKRIRDFIIKHGNNVVFNKGDETYILDINLSFKKYKLILRHGYITVEVI